MTRQPIRIYLATFVAITLVFFAGGNAFDGEFS